MVFLAFAMIFAAAISALLVVYPRLSHPARGQAIELEFNGDESLEERVERLRAAGLVEHPRLFVWYLTLTGRSKHFARGVHLVPDDLSPRDLAERVGRGPNVPRVRVVIPEGFSRFDIAKRLESSRVAGARTFLRITEDPAFLQQLGINGASVEGYLFPATYEFAENSDPYDLVLRLKSEFDRRFAALARIHTQTREELGKVANLTDEKLVILASLIEKEAATDDERPIVASVFVNRLTDPAFRPKKLQSDPSSGYGCLVHGAKIPACAKYRGKITHDINVDPANDYSTYVHEGLPPTPICNPGSKSLAAAFNPAKTRYLYFVARGGGRHVFSETYEAHTQAIRALAQKQP